MWKRTSDDYNQLLCSLHRNNDPCFPMGFPWKLPRQEQPEKERRPKINYVQESQNIHFKNCYSTNLSQWHGVYWIRIHPGKFKRYGELWWKVRKSFNIYFKYFQLRSLQCLNFCQVFAVGAKLSMKSAATFGKRRTHNLLNCDTIFYQHNVWRTRFGTVHCHIIIISYFRGSLTTSRIDIIVYVL